MDLLYIARTLQCLEATFIRRILYLASKVTRPIYDKYPVNRIFFSKHLVNHAIVLANDSSIILSYKIG